MYSVKPLSMVQPKIVPVARAKKQLSYWQQACKEFGPRGPGSRLGSCSVSSYYDKSSDPIPVTASSPKELAEVRAAQRKQMFEVQWANIAK